MKKITLDVPDRTTLLGIFINYEAPKIEKGIIATTSFMLDTRKYNGAMIREVEDTSEVDEVEFYEEKNNERSRN